MLLRFLTISALIFVVFSATQQSQAPLLPSTSDNGPHIDNAQKNAPQIFNALHSSMRQWGSSLKHNGMSFFPASIPNNTLLYHGTHEESPFTGMEWLAFEIEHAELFAWSSPPPRKFPGYHPPPMEFMKEFTDDELPENTFKHAYLHIYRPKRPLSNLLYVDGMSAAKTPMGTMDTQDLILRNNGSKSTHPGWDFERGEDLCAVG